MTKNRCVNALRGAAVASAGLWLVLAGGPSRAAVPPLAGLTPVPDAELAGMRGGFVGRDFRIDFRLESVVRVGGELRARTVVQLPLGNRGGGARAAQQGQQRLDAPPGRGAGREAGAVQVVQNGPGNTALALAAAADTLPGHGVVIQNSLDNQTLQSFRIIDVNIAGVSQLQQIGVQRRIDAAVIQSLR